MTKMGERSNTMACEQLGKEKLQHFQKLIEGSSKQVTPALREEPCSADDALRAQALALAPGTRIETVTAKELKSKKNAALLNSMGEMLAANMSKFTNARTLAQKRATLTEEDMRTLAVVAHDGTLYGFIAYKLHQIEAGEPTDYVYEEQVDEKVQQKGLGSAMLAKLESISRADGTGRVTLSCYKKNRRCTERFHDSPLHMPHLTSPCLCVHVTTTASHFGYFDSRPPTPSPLPRSSAPCTTTATRVIPLPRILAGWGHSSSSQNVLNESGYSTTAHTMAAETHMAAREVGRTARVALEKTAERAAARSTSPVRRRRAPLVCISTVRRSTISSTDG